MCEINKCYRSGCVLTSKLQLMWQQEDLALAYSSVFSIFILFTSFTSPLPGIHHAGVYCRLNI